MTGAASGAPPPKPVRSDDLKARAASGAVLVAAAAAELYLGGSYFVASVAVLAAGMIWEALNLTGVRGLFRRVWATALAALALLSLMPVLPNGGAPLWAVFCLMGATLIIAWSAAKRRRFFPFGMTAATSVCLGCLVLVLAEVRSSFYTVPPLLLLVPAVIGTDVGAYFTGRRVGGPRLAPRVSPNKTWAGAVGGGVTAVCFGLLVLWLLRGRLNGMPPLAEVVPLLLGLSVCAQIGDLIESWLKRRAGRKDSGKLIPGHGGLLDRFDGFLGASVLGLGPWLLLQELGG